MKVAVIGAGWAGLAAAVQATRMGHSVTVFEASRALGGRARALAAHMPDGTPVTLDNGQHILAGAYTQTLSLMRRVGVEPARVLLRMPLTLRFPDGTGLSLPHWPAPFDAAWGIARAKGWTARDKLSLLRGAGQWRAARFDCAPEASVAELARGLTPRVMNELIEPLCVSALNTPASRASGQVFLAVIRDALFAKGFAGWPGSNLLIPNVDLGTVFPDAAARWLAAQGAGIVMAHRVGALARSRDSWQVDGQVFERVILACPPWDAARLVRESAANAAWAAQAERLQHEAITTVYAAGGPALALPMLALRTSARSPAQFVFDRARLGGPAGLLAFVVSASSGERDALQSQVIAQGHALGWKNLAAVQTVVEKRATFACTPGLQRPPGQVAPGLLACGDYIAGPYPSTLEGAVRSGLAACALTLCDTQSSAGPPQAASAPRAAAKYTK